MDGTWLPPVRGEVGKVGDFGHPVPIRLGSVAGSAQLHQHCSGGLWSMVEQHLHHMGLGMNSVSQVYKRRSGLVL